MLEDQFELDLRQATGAGETRDTSSKLSKVFQLSGFSDPVYAEAYVHVHQYDILLDGQSRRPACGGCVALPLLLAEWGWVGLYLLPLPFFFWLGFPFISFPFSHGAQSSL